MARPAAHRADAPPDTAAGVERHAPAGGLFPGDAVARLSPGGDVLWASDAFVAELGLARADRESLAAALGATCWDALITRLSGGARDDPVDLSPAHRPAGAPGRIRFDFRDDGLGEGLLVRVRPIAPTGAKGLRSKLSRVAHRSASGVLVVNAQGLIEWLNPAFTAITGYTPADAIGRSPPDILHSDRSDPATLRQIADAIAANRTLTVEVQNRTKSGEHIWFSLSIHPFQNDEGRPGGYFSVQNDITEIRARAAELEKARADAVAARERLAAAIEALPDGFVHYDRDDKLLYCNEKYRQIYPNSKPVLVQGKRFEDILRYGLDRGEYAGAIGREEDWLAERLAAHEAANRTLEQQLTNGRWLRIIERRAADGGRVGLRIDITELKRKEAELQSAYDELLEVSTERTRAQRRFADVVSVSEDWIWETDTEGRFTYVSHAVGAALGRAPDTLLGRGFEALAERETGGRAANWQWLEARLAARESVRDFVFGLRDAGDAARWMRLSATPFEDDLGRFQGYRGVGTDVTALYRALTEAEAANRAKSDFLAMMSHEIRTPLNGVLGLAQELGLRLREPSNIALTDAIRDSGGVLMNVINDILDFSKIEAGRMHLEVTPFSFPDLSGRIVALHGPHAAEKALAFSVGIAPGARAPRLGDPHRILQIIHNLVSNALKFTHEGKVDLSVRAGPAGVEIEVTDTGIGMTREEASHVFDGFTQAQRSVTREYGGTGLGMTITRRLAEAMGGRVTLESRKGEGTRVTVSLPLDLAPETGGTPPRPVVAEGACAGRRLLVADDTATNRLLMDLMLKRLGARARVVDGGPAALEAAAEEDFDLLLLDISMPGMDGIQTLAAIRRQAQATASRAPPAIAVTANAMRHQVGEYLAAGFSAHVPKPVTREALEAAVARALAQAVPA